jgi:hypothetical protein
MTGRSEFDRVEDTDGLMLAHAKSTFVSYGIKADFHFA